MALQKDMTRIVKFVVTPIAVLIMFVGFVFLWIDSQITIEKEHTIPGKNGIELYGIDAIKGTIGLKPSLRSEEDE